MKNKTTQLFAKHQSPRVFDNRFPLTPALSPGERESRIRFLDQPEPFHYGDGRETILPLPGGEGRGEGKESAATPMARSFAIALTFSTLLLAAVFPGAVARGAAADTIRIERTPDSLGFLPPIKISISGLPIEAESILKFDLLFMGFTNVPPDQAEYLVNGSVSGGVTSGRVLNRINKNEVLAKGFSGGNQRTQIHALADLIAEKLTLKPGIAQTKITFKVQPHTQGIGEIYIADYDGFNAQAVTQDNAIAAAPCWAGHSMLFYISYKNGKPDIFSHNLATGARKPVARFNGSNISPSVSPDGKRLAMILSKSGSPDLYVGDLDGGNLRQLTHTKEEESSPCWAPDNRTICFVSRKTGSTALYKISV
ncbi:MAG TPA: hypothetical protein VFA77_06165, partial [Candidatus Eisenbacteria bacterium]|nr:hypothetical protein [Candidatus Eisenbacteria bacterium]